jgi:hypothetical protein
MDPDDLDELAMNLAASEDNLEDGLVGGFASIQRDGPPGRKSLSPLAMALLAMVAFILWWLFGR